MATLSCAVMHRDPPENMFPATTLHAGCKVNIYLDILRQRDDGFHELRTLFLPLPEPHDTMIVRPGPAGTGLRLTCLGRRIDAGDNILLRVHKAFSKFAKTTPDLEVQLTKRIPMGAGLGGGSSNAAAFLNYLNRFGLSSPLDDKQVQTLAAGIGADVPFFLYNRPAWAEGIGDVLHPAAISLAGFSSVVVCPDTRVSTAWAYQAWDDARSARHGKPGPDLLTGLELKDIVISWPNLFFYNSFEYVVFSAYPHLRNIKEKLLAQGAAGAVLSGSGASIIAIFRDPRSMENASHWMGQIGLEHYKHAFHFESCVQTDWGVAKR